MAIYTVHEPPPRASETAPDPERFAFVRDGFAFWAFALAPLWMIRHRMWLVLLGYLALTGLLYVALHIVGASATILSAVSMLLALLVGIEAATLRRFALARRGWRNAGIVVGEDLEAAERRFFDAWSRAAAGVWNRAELRAPPAPAVARPLAPGQRAAPEVIGLFPEPGAPR